VNRTVSIWARRRRRDQHRHDQDDPDRLEADHDRERDEGQEQVLQPLDGDPRRRGTGSKVAQISFIARPRR
jgi:hypothetical protein